LRQKLEEVEQARVTSALVTEEMLKHIGEVLTAARGGGRVVDLYSSSGRFNTPTPANVFEAVG
jgi:hypothetical protein